MWDLVGTLVAGVIAFGILYGGLTCAKHVFPKDPSDGTLRGECYPNKTCNEKLTCVSDVCVELPVENENILPK